MFGGLRRSHQRIALRRPNAVMANKRQERSLKRAKQSGRSRPKAGHLRLNRFVGFCFSAIYQGARFAGRGKASRPSDPSIITADNASEILWPQAHVGS